MYYNIIDPGTFGLSSALSAGGVIQLAMTDKDYKSGSVLLSLSITSLILTALFLIFNFRKSHQNRTNKIRESAKRKTYNALYDNGDRNRGGEDMTIGMFLYAFASFVSSLVLICIGLLIIVATTHNNEDLSNDNADKDEMTSAMMAYFYTMGVFTSTCGVMGLIRLPLEYFIASFGVHWLMSVIFN